MRQVSVLALYVVLCNALSASGGRSTVRTVDKATYLLTVYVYRTTCCII